MGCGLTAALDEDEVFAALCISRYIYAGYMQVYMLPCRCIDAYICWVLYDLVFVLSACTRAYMFGVKT